MLLWIMVSVGGFFIVAEMPPWREFFFEIFFLSVVSLTRIKCLGLFHIVVGPQSLLISPAYCIARGLK